MIQFKLCLFATLLFVSLFLRSGCDDDNDPTPIYKTESKLRKKLFESYDKDVIPLKTYNDPIDVQVGLTLAKIKELGDDDGEFEGLFFVKLSWNDPRLVWDAKDQGNIKDIAVSYDKIWIPDIVLYNGESELAYKITPLQAIVQSSGDVLWVPPVEIELLCSNGTEISNPDEKNGNLTINSTSENELVCAFKYGSWVFDARRIHLTLADDGFNIEKDALTEPWKLVEKQAVLLNKTYPCCPDAPYTSASFVVKLKKGD